MNLQVTGAAGSARPAAGLIPETAAADRLGLSVRTLQNWRIKGFGPKFIKAGRAIRYDAAELDAWLAGRKVGSTTEADLLP